MSLGRKRNALEGITVLDLTRLLPGAFCTQMLADMGAEVVKIEDPRGGDYNRSWEPKARTESGSFLLLNRNKKSVTLNLKHPDGHAAFLRLARNADIILEGFRPGVMDRLGLGYEKLRADNPGLIFCSISGYGQDGPLRSAPGHDINYLGTAGALQLFGKAGEGPIVPGLSIADVGGGSLMASSGILAALYSRSVDGQGQYIDISMTDGAAAWLSLHGAEYLFNGTEPRGGEQPWIGQAPCYNIYRCADDRYVALGALETHFWQRFCDMVQLPDDLRTHYPQGEEAERQRAALSSLFLTRTREQWAAEGETADIPLTAVNDMGEAFQDPQMVHREMLLHVDHPVEGRIPQLGFPVKFGGTPCDIRMPPPTLGEHNEEVLARAGYEPAAIAAMKSSGAI